MNAKICAYIFIFYNELEKKVENIFSFKTAAIGNPTLWLKHVCIIPPPINEISRSIRSYDYDFFSSRPVTGDSLACRMRATCGSFSHVRNNRSRHLRFSETTLLLLFLGNAPGPIPSAAHNKCRFL